MHHRWSLEQPRLNLAHVAVLRTRTEETFCPSWFIVSDPNQSQQQRDKNRETEGMPVFRWKIGLEFSRFWMRNQSLKQMIRK